jgi:hypothetical protein
VWPNWSAKAAPSDDALLVADEGLRALRTELDYLEVLAG